MRIRAIVIAGLGASLLSSAAWAADFGGRSVPDHRNGRLESADQCAALESQYDAVIGSHQNASHIGRAEGLHATGLGECNSNDGSVGVIKLEQALKTLGVTPNA